MRSGPAWAGGSGRAREGRVPVHSMRTPWEGGVTLEGVEKSQGVCVLPGTALQQIPGEGDPEFTSPHRSATEVPRKTGPMVAKCVDTRGSDSSSGGQTNL